MSTDTPEPKATFSAAAAEAPGFHPRRFWSWRPLSDRQSGDAVVSNFLLHWFPAKSYRASFAWSYSFWLGTVSAALLLLLTVSGLPLLFLYIPSVERAYASVKDIEYVVTFGSWIRAVHRLSAHGMVIAVALHLVRVYLTGAYKNAAGGGQRRQWNWVLGVAMLLITLFLSFTGYLLPWDQLAFWAVTVGTNIASSVPAIGPMMRELLIGGREIEQPTLIRFYVLHVLFLPALLGLLFAYHMWRIRKDGGMAAVDRAASTVPAAPVKTKSYTLMGIARGASVQVEAAVDEGGKEGIRSSPHLVRRLAVVFIRLLGSVQALMAIEFTLGGALRGAGDTRFPLFVVLAGMVVMRLGTAVTLNALGFSVEWIYAALIADYVVKGAMLIWRFRSGHWKTVLAREPAPVSSPIEPSEA